MNIKLMYITSLLGIGKDGYYGHYQCFKNIISIKLYIRTIIDKNDTINNCYSNINYRISIKKVKFS